MRDEGARSNSATQNAIGNALALLLDTVHGDRDDTSKLKIKEVLEICHGKFCSINGARICRLVDENLCKERAMLTQADTKTKAPFANRNGKPDKSDGLDPQFATLKKELTLAQREIRLQISRTNYIKPRRIWQRNVQNAVPRARTKIPQTMKLGVREPITRLE